jgi:hypothetical protein
MELCAVRVIFSAVANKGRQLGGSVSYRQRFADTRETKGRKPSNLLIRQFEAFI